MEPFARRSASLLTLAAIPAILLITSPACQNQHTDSSRAETTHSTQPQGAQVSAPQSSPSRATQSSDAFEERARVIARSVIQASPPADPDDARARDLAAERLARIGMLVDATDAHVLWGHFDEAVQFNAEDDRLIELTGEVWARLYLSCFTFTGEPRLARHDDLLIVEFPARFRSRLAPGEYPHPFWHNSHEWLSYAGATSVLLVFESDLLTRAYFKSDPAVAGTETPPQWDRNWTWTDPSGAKQPRVAQFSYVLSRENPHLRTLSAVYNELLENFEQQSCLKCHSPSNRAKADVLFLLGYPNQALAAREGLVEVLQKNTMPPADPAKRFAKGIHDDAVRAAMIDLAERFRDEGDAALSYEGIYLIRPDEYPAER